MLAGCSTPPSKKNTPPPARITPVAPRPYAPPAPPLVTSPTANPVLLVKATSSAPNEAERRFAARLTARMAQRLKDSGIPVKQITDDDITKGVKLKGKVMILPYNPKPTPQQILGLTQFVGNGGKLIVFFGAEPRLAALMGFKLGILSAATGSDICTAFQFVEGAPRGVPERVKQHSTITLPAHPAETGTRVIAWWEDGKGHRTSIPAWTRSNRGFWMSHVFLEGDIPEKQQLLVSLLGACDSTLLQAAAAHAMNTAGTLDRYRNVEQSIEATSAQANHGKQGRAVQALLSEARILRNNMVAQHQKKDYPAVLQMAPKLDKILTEAIARTQTPQANEFRGLWNHSGAGFSPGTWAETCRLLSQGGITAILPNVQQPWCADYPSSIIPRSGLFSRYGDQLEICLTASHREGLETHAWVILWSIEGAPEYLIAPYRKAGRLQVSHRGKTINWLCPTHPDNRTYELAALRELATKYPALDGIQLDYIRYQSADSCYCNGCRTRFQKATGITIQEWPAEVRSGPRMVAFKEWRRNQITQFVAAARKQLKQVNPRLKLSASVYPLYPGTRDSIGQDWGEWLRQDLVDFVCPMNYTEDHAKFTTWYRKQASYPGARGKVFAGIGITATESRLNAVQTLDQIQSLRREGATGFTLFEANTTFQNDILPYLRMGATAK